MLLKMIVPVVLSICFISTISVVSGAPNTKDLQAIENSQEYEVQILVNCRTAQQYKDVSEFSFNPRSVAVEDTACLSLQMFRDLGFIQYFDIPVDTLSMFILQAQRGYRSVPYHNWYHAFAVLQFCYAILKNCRLVEKHYLTHLEGLALLTAAMCHDVDHRGTTNQFQTLVSSSLAQRYGDQGSILERHHIAVMLAFLQKPDSNFVAHLDENKHYQFQNLVQQIILATDLSIHFKVVGEEKRMAATGFDKRNERHRQLLRSVIISCADLSDQTKDWNTVRLVAKLIYTEFFNQGDQERQMGLKPITMMDRNQAKIPQLQIDFLSQVVFPIYQVLLSLCPETQACMDTMQQNLMYWRKAIPYFEDQSNQGRNQLNILLDHKLDNISCWT